MSKKNLSRRDFMRNTAAQAASVATVIGSQASAQGAGPNERIGLGFIGVGNRGKVLLRSLAKLRNQRAGFEPVAVCDVFNRYRDQAASQVLEQFHAVPAQYRDYRDLLADKKVDVVCIATPDHWHARMILDALAAGKHVYCETPLVHSLHDIPQVLEAWQQSGLVLQVGAQRTSDGRWQAAHDFICAGKIGKILHGQTHYFRNSTTGQWRYQGLSRDMTPQNIDWEMFLGTEFGLAPPLPFDRAHYAQWQCYQTFSHGPYSDLYGQVLSQLMLAMGVRFPARVVSGGGIFLEYDGREVPDTASIIADFDAGCQLVVTATMGNDHRIEECIRGHHGTIVFDLSRDGFDFLPQRPQVTRRRDLKPEHVAASKPQDETAAHWENFLAAVTAGDPAACHHPPDLAAAATVTSLMGAQSYREGKVLYWDPANQQVVDAARWARRWEEMSKNHAKPRHVSGWDAGDAGSQQRSPSYQKLAGPWLDGKDPAV